MENVSIAAGHPEFWVIFILFVIGMLALDLGVFNRNAHKVSVKEAAFWSAFWIGLSLIFWAGLWYFDGQEIALQWIGGYLLEKSLSVDNIFVFVLIFSYFKVPGEYQHRVLFWGIISALVLRGVMIGLGAALVAQFEWIITIFGAFLVYTAIRMAREEETDIDMDSNPIVRLLRRFMPVTTKYHGEKFTIIENGKRVATPLLVVLLLIESSDVIFAVDSIPAIFGITTDPFIVFTSNIFAILGLRSLYFLLAGVIEKFHYLKLGLSVVLGFVGVKMLIESISDYAEQFGYLDHAIHFPIEWSLLFIASVLTISVIASLMFPKAVEEHAPAHDPTNIPEGSQPPAEAMEP
jgi:tellurite resistance protein TerC